jgi:hypothetical protein
VGEHAAAQALPSGGIGGSVNFCPAALAPDSQAIQHASPQPLWRTSRNAHGKRRGTVMTFMIWDILTVTVAIAEKSENS